MKSLKHCGKAMKLINGYLNGTDIHFVFQCRDCMEIIEGEEKMEDNKRIIKEYKE